MVPAMAVLAVLALAGLGTAHGQVIDLDTRPAQQQINMVQNDYGDVVATFLNNADLGTRGLVCNEFEGVILDRIPVGVFEDQSRLERVYGLNSGSDWIDHLNARNNPKGFPGGGPASGIYDYWQYNSNWREASETRVPRGYVAPGIEIENNYGKLRPSNIPDNVQYMPSTITLPFWVGPASDRSTTRPPGYLEQRTYELNDGTLLNTEDHARYSLGHFNISSHKHEALIYVTVPNGLPGAVTLSINHVQNVEDGKTDINHLSQYIMQPGRHYLIKYQPDPALQTGHEIIEITYTIANNGRGYPQGAPFFAYRGRDSIAQATWEGNRDGRNFAIPNEYLPGDVSARAADRYYYGGVNIIVGSTIYPATLPISNGFMISGYGYGFSGHGQNNIIQFPGQYVTALPGAASDVWVAFRSGGAASFVNQGVPYRDVQTFVANGDVFQSNSQDRTGKTPRGLGAAATWTSLAAVNNHQVTGTNEILFYTLTPFIDTNPETKDSGAYPVNSIVIPRQLVDDLPELRCNGFVFAPGFSTTPSPEFRLQLTESVQPPGTPSADVISAFNITIRDLFPGGQGVFIRGDNFTVPTFVPPEDGRPTGQSWRSMEADGAAQSGAIGEAASYVNYKIPLNFNFDNFVSHSIFGKRPEVPDCTVVNTQTTERFKPRMLAAVPITESTSGGFRTLSFGLTDGNPVDGRQLINPETGYGPEGNDQFTGAVFFVAPGTERNQEIYQYLGRPGAEQGDIRELADSSHFDNYEVTVPIVAAGDAVMAGFTRDRLYDSYYDPLPLTKPLFQAVLQVTGKTSSPSTAYSLTCEWDPKEARDPEKVLNMYLGETIKLESQSTSPLFLTLLTELQNENPIGLGDGPLEFGGVPFILVIVSFLGMAGFSKRHLPSGGIIFFMITVGLSWFGVISLTEVTVTALIFVVIVLVFNRGLRS